MRPRLSELEMSFLLDLLKETSALKKRQLLNLQEEKEHLQRTIYALRDRMIRFEPYPTYKILNSEKEKLATLEREWLPVYDKQTVLLKCLIIRLEKILSHKSGRVPRTSFFYRKYLEEWNQKTLKKQHSRSIVN
jgi:predicted  nucleic acid-binding Zn-ribbon protein